MDDILAEIKLTTSEYAAIRGCSERYVKKICQEGKIDCELSSKKSRGGSSGMEKIYPGVSDHL